MKRTRSRFGPEEIPTSFRTRNKRLSLHAGACPRPLAQHGNALSEMQGGVRSAVIQRLHSECKSVSLLAELIRIGCNNPRPRLTQIVAALSIEQDHYSPLELEPWRYVMLTRSAVRLPPGSRLSPPVSTAPVAVRPKRIWPGSPVWFTRPSRSQSSSLCGAPWTWH